MTQAASRRRIRKEIDALEKPTRDCLFTAYDPDPCIGDDEGTKVLAITPAAPGWLRADAMETSVDDDVGAQLWGDPMPVANWVTTPEATIPVAVGASISDAVIFWAHAALISQSGVVFGSDAVRYDTLDAWLKAVGRNWREAAKRRAERAKNTSSSS